MAYYCRIIAADGKPLTLCIAGPAIPLSMDHVEYVNPRTGKTERYGGGVTAWAGGPDTPCNAKVGTSAKIVR